MQLQTLAVSDFDVCKSFLQRGYLPEVFPPIFTSKAWSENIDLKKLVIDAPKDTELNKISYSLCFVGVAKYYSSIYTHVIPWALNGKEAAKNDRSPFSKLVFANELDWAIRIGQGNQTKGTADAARSEVMVDVISISSTQVLQESKQRLAGARYIVRARMKRFGKRS